MANNNQKSPAYKKWWFWLIIVVVLICIGGVAGSSDKDAKKVGEGGTSEQSGSDNSTFKIGDVIAIDGQEITVTNVQRNWTGEYSKPDAGKEYVKVSVKIENKSDETTSYNSLYWSMEDGNGAIESEAFVIGNDDALNSGDLAKGGKKAGSIVFEVPQGDQKLKVHYKPNMFSSREAIIEL